MILYKKYVPIIKGIVSKKINRAAIIGLDYNDLYQEGIIGLTEAVNSYRDVKDITFYSYACLCIKRKVETLLRTNSRLKHTCLNNALSIYDTIGSDNNINFIDIIEDEKNPNIEDFIIDNEEKEIFYNKINKKLTKMESIVFDLKVKGYEPNEIAFIIKKSKKTVYNAIDRIKKKLKDMYKDSNMI